ncbi:MAG: hypothetical protein ACK5KP_00455 [Paludibacteraceae bacterium]
MKQQFFFLTVFLLFTTQVAISQVAYEKGDKIGQIGIGLGSGIGLPINVGYEVGITEKISVGGTVGFASHSIPSFGGNVSIMYIPVGAKGAYHFYVTDNIDAYGGAVLGYLVASANYPANYSWAKTNYGSVMYGGYLGGRYYFTPSLGAFAEIGYTSLGYLSVGLSYKF